MPPDVAGKRGGNPPGRLSFNLKFPIPSRPDSELGPLAGKPGPVSRVRGSRLGRARSPSRSLANGGPAAGVAGRAFRGLQVTPSTPAVGPTRPRTRAQCLRDKCSGSARLHWQSVRMHSSGSTQGVLPPQRTASIDVLFRFPMSSRHGERCGKACARL
jgi:hypothetical protein